MPRVLPLVEALVERAPYRTIFTRFIPPAQPEDMPGRWRDYYEKWHEVTRARVDPEWLQLVPELKRFVPPALVFDKLVYSAFASRELSGRLQAEQVDTLIITGSETDVCVLSSVLGAVDRGYRVIVVQDAVCSSSDASHDALLELYKRRFSIQIEVAEAEDIVREWQVD
jgi:nicotinamidase-related amidase